MIEHALSQAFSDTFSDALRHSLRHSLTRALTGSLRDCFLGSSLPPAALLPTASLLPHPPPPLCLPLFSPLLLSLFVAFSAADRSATAVVYM